MLGATRFEGLQGTLLTFTASGQVTNLAARLARDFFLEPLGPQAFKNLEAVEVYRLMGERTG